MTYRFLRARRELAVAQFKLEREHALVRRASAITFGGLLIEFVMGVWAISTLVAPTLRDIRVGEGGGDSSAPRAFITSTPVANAPVNLNVNPLEQQGEIIFATPPPTATPVGTIIPDMPAPVGCAEDAAWIFIPGNGQLLFEATTVWGTASVSKLLVLSLRDQTGPARRRVCANRRVHRAGHRWTARRPAADQLPAGGLPLPPDRLRQHADDDRAV